MSDRNIESEQLKEWYANFLKLFREEYSKLSEIEKKHISKTQNYNSNCQIEVFWLKQPNWQLIVTTHFEDRADGEITINGPYDSSVFQDEVKKILNHSRWNQPLYRKTRNLLPHSPRLYNELLAQYLHRFIERAKNAMFINFPVTDRIITESIVLGDGVIEHVFGDMRYFDYKLLIKKMIQDAKEQIEYNKKLQNSHQEQTQQMEYHKGFGTYFFPPIVVGKILKPTLSDIVDGVKNIDFPTFDKKAFDIVFNQIPVIVTKDGYLGVCVNSKETSLEILNTIMAVSVLEGIEAYAVREYELSKIDYDPQTCKITGFSYDQRTIRNELFYGAQKDKILEFRRKEIDENVIRKIFEKASKIFDNKTLSDELRVFLEAITHLKDSEFPQAFLMGWIIIEQHISQKWKNEIQQPSNNPKEKAANRLPKVDIMIKELNSKGKITSQGYTVFMDLKEIRNKHLHSGKQVTKEEAENCVNMAREIVLKKYET